jgi:hypothetical protein
MLKLYRRFFQQTTAHDLLDAQMYNVQMQYLQHVAAAEYHQAMADMLKKRVERLSHVAGRKPEICIDQSERRIAALVERAAANTAHVGKIA